jgi:hypothetical protein
MDPILKYLIEFNQNNPIEYSDQYILPAGGLQEMLDGYKGFHLNKVTVTKSEVIPPPQPKAKQTIEDLYKLLD